MTALLERAGAHLLACCSQPRYKTAWIVGPPLSGKTTLARQLCQLYGWRHLNYTLEPGYFDRLQGRLETYQPGDLLTDLRQWCVACDRPLLLVDEIDALLAVWSFEQRRLFAAQASRLPDLPRGIILVSNLLDVDVLAPLLPDSDLPTYLHLPGGKL
ncbi:MAG: ATP-binding protein [Chloroflexales bacterium]|nr:ATP-binding protein [Chloroflexales bacterium]